MYDDLFFAFFIKMYICMYVLCVYMFIYAKVRFLEKFYLCSLI